MAITDANYAEIEVCKSFEIKNFGEYHDLYVEKRFDTSN